MNPDLQSDPMEEVLAEIRTGRMVIVMNDAEGEVANEGHLVMAAERAAPEALNFMMLHARGMIWVAITHGRAVALELPRMANLWETRESRRMDFTFSVDAPASKGVTTGIGVMDRAKTIKVLLDPHAEPGDLVRPGHINPLVAKEHGVLQRPEHAEAAVDLVRLAGCQPAGVLCEILDDHGTLACLSDVMKFKSRHGLKLCTITQLIAHRLDRGEPNGPFSGG